MVRWIKREEGGRVSCKGRERWRWVVKRGEESGGKVGFLTFAMDVRERWGG